MRSAATAGSTRKPARLPHWLIWALFFLFVQFGLWVALIASRPGLFDIVAIILNAVPALMLAPAVYGILRHGRFAYRYLKVGTLLVAPIAFTFTASLLILFAIGATMFPKNQLPIAAYGLVVFTVASIGTLIALDRRSVKEYVGLKCPRCGTFRTRAADLLCARSRCKKCRVTW